MKHRGEGFHYNELAEQRQAKRLFYALEPESPFHDWETLRQPKGNIALSRGPKTHLCADGPEMPRCAEKLQEVTGNSLMIQWLELITSTVRAWVQSLVKELKSRKLHSVAK